MTSQPRRTSETDLTRRRYDRLSRVYDLMMGPAERRMAGWRRNLWGPVQGPDILEVGVGTGRNMAYYPAGRRVVAIDLSQGMLAYAKHRAEQLAVDVDLRQGDVQTLDMADASFDDVVAAFVFCSVPDPVRGLEECRRVLKPGGRLHLLEHVRSRGLVGGWLMDLANGAARAMTGANINRRTAANIGRAGFALQQNERVAFAGLVRLFRATPASGEDMADAWRE